MSSAEVEAAAVADARLEGPLAGVRIHMSGDMAPLFGALAKAQADMDGGGVTKDRTNPHFKSQYTTLAATLAVALPALSKHGIAVIQPPTSTPDGGSVHVTTLLAHSSGAWISASLSLRPQKNDPQGVGSATTYGRRYTLQGLVGLAPEDDDGNGAAAHQPASPPQGKPRQQESRRKQSQAKPAATTAAKVPDNIRASIKGAASVADLKAARQALEVAHEGGHVTDEQYATMRELGVERYRELEAKQ